MGPGRQTEQTLPLQPTGRVDVQALHEPVPDDDHQDRRRAHEIDDGVVPVGVLTDTRPRQLLAVHGTLRSRHDQPPVGP